MMKIGTHYAYWNNMWAADYIALCHRAKKCGLDVLEVGADHLLNLSDAQLEEILSVDTALWKDEVAGIEEFFGKFDRLPETLKAELETLKANIK